MRIILIIVALSLTIQSQAQERNSITENFIVQSKQQEKWYAITKNDIVIVSLQILSGSADGLNQSIVHHRFGREREFWNYKESWKRKYSDFDGGDHSAAFIGSKTWLVMFTDGFHLTRFIDRTSTLFTIGISASDIKRYPKKDRWKVVAKKILLSGLANKLAFIVVYNGTDHNK